VTVFVYTGEREPLTFYSRLHCVSVCARIDRVLLPIDKHNTQTQRAAAAAVLEKLAAEVHIVVVGGSMIWFAGADDAIIARTPPFYPRVS